MADLTGQSIGRYQILARLGEGGMATVYRARDTRLDRDVALKLIRVDQFAPAMMGHILARFEREAKSLARLSHHSIVRVYDYGEHDGVPYLVLEFCGGGDLKQRLSGKPTDWQEAIRLILPVARALHYSHQQGVIHRDVKPSNIMFNTSGEPMLSDFGIAKMLETDDAATLTGTGVGIGTPGYMAPEQWTGETSPQSDQYGLGVVLYELLAGRKPYESDTPAGILIKQTSQPLPAPRQFAPEIPPEVEAVLLKSLDRDPAMRYSDMADFINIFEGLLQQVQAVGTRPAPMSEAQPMVDPYKTVDFSTVPEEKPHPVTPTEWATTANPLPKRKPANWKPIVIGGAAIIILAGMLWGGMQLSKGFPALPEPSATLTGTAMEIQTNLPSKVFTLIPSATQADTQTSEPTLSSRAVTPTPTFGFGSVLTREKDGMVMLYVPQGDFPMGNALGNNGKHMVYLDGYWIDKTEVTNAMYARCVQDHACQPPLNRSSRTRSSYYDNPVRADFPVIYVNWNDARSYCEWAGGRLPSEAEWEKAESGSEGSDYPWGNSPPTDKLANFYIMVGDTTRVGSYPQGASPNGALDMIGNVWEWTNDWHDSAYYQNAPTSNPQGPASGDGRVMRGGSWSDIDYQTRARLGIDPTRRNDGTGFRCASSVPPATVPAASVLQLPDSPTP